MASKRFVSSVVAASSLALVATGVVAPTAGALTATIAEDGSCTISHNIEGEAKPKTYTKAELAGIQLAEEIAKLGATAGDVDLNDLGDIVGSFQNNIDLAISSTGLSSNDEDMVKANKSLIAAKAALEYKSALEACKAGKEYTSPETDSSSGINAEFDNSSRDDEGNLTPGTIAAIVLGSLAAVAAVIAAVLPVMQGQFPFGK